jgi:uncharacterized protein (DUF427 family)
MTRAIVDGIVIAESDETVVVEGNHYFPPESVKREHIIDSGLNTTCPWKGRASYYTVKVGDTKLDDVAWYYPDPSEAAAEIRNHVAFYPKVTITQ